ncbi:hypothetical protein [Aneurinibacillus terranovensis]|uniref:hypothetical protein n=1 Tax=Aneurinibacillus terranovensis TaxID=278991 RepID=UPI00041FD538|nr:hypothetical protein [Aneurinibacillus terranovensis]
MKKLLVIGLTAATLLTPQLAFADGQANQPVQTEKAEVPSLKVLDQKNQKVLFKEDQITDVDKILKKARKLTDDEIKKEGLEVISTNKDEKLKVDAYRYDQKLQEVENSDGSRVSLYASNTITGIYTTDTRDRTDNTASVSVHEVYYYYYYTEAGSAYVKGHAFYANFSKLDSQVSGFTNLTLHMQEGGNVYGGGRIAPDKVIDNPIVGPTFGVVYKIFEPDTQPFHYINITDNLSATSGWFKATLKRGTGTWIFTDGILQGNGAFGP